MYPTNSLPQRKTGGWEDPKRSNLTIATKKRSQTQICISRERQRDKTKKKKGLTDVLVADQLGKFAVVAIDNCDCRSPRKLESVGVVSKGALVQRKLKQHERYECSLLFC